jgi:hypothetical protein
MNQVSNFKLYSALKMKKFIPVILFAFLFVFTACQPTKDKQESELNENSTDSTKMSYACPMHPEITGDQPGKCSKCGMDLVKKENTTEDMHSDTTKHM